MKRLLILALIVVAMVPSVRAQTSFYSDRALQQVNVLTSPTPLTAAIPYGGVRVCSLPLTQQQPCLPLATITDINGNPVSNAIGPLFGQLTTDATGRFTFGCTLGLNYQVQVAASASNTPAANYPITCPGVGANPQFTSATTAALNGCQHVNALQTFAAALVAVSNPGCIEVDPGTYTVSANATIPSGVTLRSTSGGLLSIATGVTLTVNGPIVASVGVIFAYVGTGVASLGPAAIPAHAVWFPGADMGVKLNNTYAALPAGGGPIYIDPVPGGGCWPITTPIVMNTSGKLVFIQGVQPTAVNGGSFLGTCLNYTPVTATSALTLDYIPSPQNTTSHEHGMANITLVNNQCITSGGCGSSATGVNVGTTNSGINGAIMDHVSIIGFGVGYLNTNILSPDVHWNTRMIWANTVGLKMGNLQDWSVNGFVFFNQTAFVGIAGNGSELHYTNEVFTGNSGLPVLNFTSVSGAAATFDCVNCHFENGSSNSIDVQYIGGKVDVNLTGGLMEDDSTVGTATSYISCSGNSLWINGTRFYVNSRPTTTTYFVLNSPCRARLDFVDENPAGRTNIVTGTNSAFATIFPHAGSSASANEVFSFESAGFSFPNGNGMKLTDNTPSHVQVVGIGANVTGNDQVGFFSYTASRDVLHCQLLAPFGCLTTTVIAGLGSACTNVELALSAGWQSTGTATVTAVAGNSQTCSWTITTGTTTAANPTVTDTLVNALPNATTVCEMNIHGGTHTAAAGEGFQQTALSATAPVFTFNGTPTAGGTTYFVTRRCGP